MMIHDDIKTAFKKALINLVYALIAGSTLTYILIYMETFSHFHNKAMTPFFTPAFLFSYSYFIIVFIQSFAFLLVAYVAIEYAAGRISSNEPELRENKLFKLRPIKALSSIAAFLYNRRHHLLGIIAVLYYINMADNVQTIRRYFTVLIVLISIIFIIVNNRKVTIISFGLFLALLSLTFIAHYIQFSSPSAKVSSKGKPNVLLIVSDTTRQDHMTFYGYKRNTTPNLQKLSQDGVVFEHAYSTSAWTKPATASLVTSRTLTQDTIHNGAYPISYEGRFMAEHFAENGYSTAIISANSNASSFFGHTKGYDYRIHSLPPEHAAFNKFITINYFENTFHLKSFIGLKNNDISLREYADFLHLSLNDLPNFINGKVKSSVKLSENEVQAYIKIIKDLIDRKAAEELKKYPVILPGKDLWYSSLVDWAYQKTLYFYYYFLEGAEGEITSYWIRDAKIGELFIDWHKNKKSGRPFFAHLQYMGPHTPYHNQLPYLLPHFDPDYESPVYAPPTQHTPPSVPAPRMTKKDLYNLTANYDNSIRATDANINSIIQYLKQTGELENTIIVFVADHGESFYEHNIYGHMNSLHAELVDIPLFFYWSGRIQPGRTAKPASIVDIYPTLAALTGTAMEEDDLAKLEGLALFNDKYELIDDERKNFALPVFTIVGSAWKMNRRSGMPFGLHSAIITPQGKLVRENEETGERYMYFTFGDKTEKREFYDMRYPNLPKTIQQLEKLLPPEPEQWKLLD